MNDILSTFYESRYSNKKSKFRLITQKEKESNDIKLKTQGIFTIIPDSQLFPAFAQNYIKTNKNMNDLHNLLHIPKTPMSSLSNSHSTLVISYPKKSKKKSARRYRKKIRHEAELRCDNLLLSDNLRQSSSQSKYPKNSFSEKMLNPFVNIRNNLSLQPDNSSLYKSNRILISNNNFFNSYCI